MEKVAKVCKEISQKLKFWFQNYFYKGRLFLEILEDKIVILRIFLSQKIITWF